MRKDLSNTDVIVWALLAVGFLILTVLLATGLGPGP